MMFTFFGILVFGILALGGGAVMAYNAGKNQRKAHAADRPHEQHAVGH